jgi:protein SCO1/2
MTQPKQNRHFLPLLVVALLSIGAGLWISQQTNPGKQLPQDLEATFLPKGKPLSVFKLVDQDEQPFGLERFKGKWSFMFFGYTNCPDVCPLSMKVMQSVWQHLPPDLLKQSQMVFVSVDPDRDKPKMLKDYVHYFHPDFIGVTGKADQLDILTRNIGVLYGFEDPPAGSKDYVVNHSAQIVLIDPDARLRAVFSPPHDSKKIAATFEKIVHFLE